MSVLAVWGAAASLLAATAEGLAILPRPGLPLVGPVAPIAALPIASLLALGAAVGIGVLQNGGRAVTLDEWKRMKDKDNYDIVYDYDYAEPYRKLIYFPASAPDDSDAYFDSAEEHGGAEEGEPEERRRVSFNTPYGPYPQYPPAQSRPQRPRTPYRAAPGPSYSQGAYPHPEELFNQRYKRGIENGELDMEMEKITKGIEELAVEEDPKRFQEEVKELSGQVLQLDRDDCLLKLLCHLQKKPQEERTLQDKTLLNVFQVTVAKDDLTCGDEFPRCPVEELQLMEAFSYLWHLQNDV
ncbi:hypothetical protein O3P69_015930 [Scylla paramamosain]|uniref:Uncharacterized protein n=1 Tax=Scylla paramamosain TaxID=85552 RepID=A0AAW0T988_SCYPA